MILFPAIDIKNGSCVRLVQGKMAEATIFNKDPVDQAKIFESKGCNWIHVVDLDGAIKGHSVNEKIIRQKGLSFNNFDTNNLNGSTVNDTKIYENKPLISLSIST